MGIKTIKTVEAICDFCEEPVDTVNREYIDATQYGKIFHLDCLSKMTAYELIRVLAILDTIFVSKDNLYVSPLSAPRFHDVFKRSF